MNPRSILAAARASGRGSLLEPEAKDVLRSYSISVPRAVVLADADDALGDLASLQAPFALKVISSGVLHKSDVGGVRVGISDIAGVRAARIEMRTQMESMGLRVEAFLVEEMASRGHELTVGGILHPQFGPVLMVGLGGVFVEVLNDVSFRICPINLRDAFAMLSELRGRAILDGARGGVVADIEAITAVLLKIGGEFGLLTELADEIAEVDLNPLIVGASGVCAVDARVILARRSP